MIPGCMADHNMESSFTLKYIGKIFKNVILKNHSVKKVETYVKAFWGSVNTELFKS